MLWQAPFSSYLDFTLKPCKGLNLFILCCFIIYVHRGCNIRVSHNLLNDLQLVSFSQKRVQNVCRKWWQLKCGNSSGCRPSALASSSSFVLHALIIRSIARLTQCGDSTVLSLDLNIKPEYPSTTQRIYKLLPLPQEAKR